MSVSLITAAAEVGSMGPGRIGASAAGVMALTGVVLGGLALYRSGSGTAQRRAVTGLGLALLGIIVGGLVALTADGGVGTGNGLGGGVVAVVVGLIGVVIAGLALARSRRTG